MIYCDKEKTWRHISLRACNYQKPIFFKVSKTGFKSRRTKTRRLPRYHAMINLFLVSYWRDNSNFRIGVGLGKRQYSINFHCMF